MEALATSLVVLIVGRAEYPSEHPHRHGHYHFPKRDISRAGILSYGWARLEPVGKAELEVLSQVRPTVVSFIQQPDVARLAKSLDQMGRPRLTMAVMEVANTLIPVSITMISTTRTSSTV